MTRRGQRKKGSAADGWVELIALLPWWAGVAAALGFYLVLHTLAQPDPAAAGIGHKPGDLGQVMTGALWRTLAMLGQYLMPFLCLMGAAASAWRGWERRRLVSQVTASEAADVLEDMSWQQFERLVGEAFRLQGYNVQETGRGGPDGGVDLILRRSGEKHLVQCKQWKAYKVGVDVVRELYGAMAAQGAAGGFVVTSGHFSREAEAFADGRNVRLVDGLKLRGWIRQAMAARETAGSTARPPAAAHAAAFTGPRNPASPAGARAEASLPANPPTCPSCEGPMVRRTARKGAQAGREFWGCEGYPVCRGIRSI